MTEITWHPTIEQNLCVGKSIRAPGRLLAGVLAEFRCVRICAGGQHGVAGSVWSYSFETEEDKLAFILKYV